MHKITIFSQKLLTQCLEPTVLDAMTKLLDSQKKSNILAGAEVITEIFGATPIFSVLMGDPSLKRDACETHLISSFHNNLTLLVQKTWVEKSDESLKEQVLFHLDKICASLNEKTYAAVYKEYFSLLHDIVYLMFGFQAKKDDFAEYSLRIDPEFGVFWWFLENVSTQMPEDIEIARLYILLGMFFSANY